jgi:hypothetical protein
MLLACSQVQAGGKVAVKNIAVEKVTVVEKTIQFGDAFKVIGIPVNQLGAEYYYQPKQNLTEDEAKRIAVAVVEELARRGIIGGVVPPSPQPSPPEHPKLSPIEITALQLIKRRCATCHTGDTAAAGLAFSNGTLELTDKTGKWDVAKIAGAMARQTLIGKMPKNGNKLTNEEVLVFQDLQDFYLSKDRKQD